MDRTSSLKLGGDTYACFSIQVYPQFQGILTYYFFLGISKHPLKGLVYIDNHTGRHSRECRCKRSLVINEGEFLLALAQCLFCPLAFSNILGNYKCRFVPIYFHGMGGDLNVDDGPIFQAMSPAL